MPALVAGIHVFLSRKVKGVDGRDKPGRDAARRICDEKWTRVTRIVLTQFVFFCAIGL